MDPNSGRLFESVEKAREAGVEDPVEIIGSRSSALRLSQAVERLHATEQAEEAARLAEPERKQMTSLQREARKKRIKAQRAARKRRR